MSVDEFGNILAVTALVFSIAYVLNCIACQCCLTDKSTTCSDSQLEYRLKASRDSLMLSVGAATLVTCAIRKRSIAVLGWLVSGLVWSMWHWPLIINGLYGNDVAPLFYQLFFFTLFITATSVIMTYLRLKTNSLWTGVIYHMSSNIFIQKIFTPITQANPTSSWYIDEFGAVIAIVAFVAAIFFWRRGVAEFNECNLNRTPAT
jgi:hypothetical protein